MTGPAGLDDPALAEPASCRFHGVLAPEVAKAGCGARRPHVRFSARGSRIPRPARQLVRPRENELCVKKFFEVMGQEPMSDRDIIIWQHDQFHRNDWSCDRINSYFGVDLVLILQARFTGFGKSIHSPKSACRTGELYD